MPTGADCVLIQEEATREGDRLHLSGEGPPRRGAHVRPAGSDFRIGDPLLAAGALLGPAAIALAAIAGHGKLPVRRRARIALVSTGDELVAPGMPTPGVLLPASNGPMLAALLAKFPTEIVDFGIIPDRIASLSNQFRTMLDSFDVVVTTGGASVGDHDLVRPALEAAGGTIDFWRIAVKPGKPMLAGRLGQAVALGLPGNPVSALVTAQLFLLPLVAQLADAAHLLPEPRPMVLLAPLPATGQRQEYVRATGTCDGVLPLRGQDSAALRNLPAADLLVVRPPHSPALDAGAIVMVLPLA
jgi:molybdopterin molybdotransferase